jgi:hypothetical protein
VNQGARGTQLTIRLQELQCINVRERNPYRILMGKLEGKRSLGRQRRRWVDKIKMDLREIGWDGVDWIGLKWLRIGTSGGLL